MNQFFFQYQQGVKQITSIHTLLEKATCPKGATLFYISCNTVRKNADMSIHGWELEEIQRLELYSQCQKTNMAFFNALKSKFMSWMKG